jgi:hypothetical protein
VEQHSVHELPVRGVQELNGEIDRLVAAPVLGREDSEVTGLEDLLIRSLFAVREAHQQTQEPGYVGPVDWVDAACHSRILDALVEVLRRARNELCPLHKSPC